jgi:hypothetical protein
MQIFNLIWSGICLRDLPSKPGSSLWQDTCSSEVLRAVPSQDTAHEHLLPEYFLIAQSLIAAMFWASDGLVKWILK